MQYFTHLPAVLVGAHMLGACLVLLAALSVQWSTRERRPVAPAPPGHPDRRRHPGTSHRLTAPRAPRAPPPAPRAPRAPRPRAPPARAPRPAPRAPRPAPRAPRPAPRAPRPAPRAPRPAPRAPRQDLRNFPDGAASDTPETATSLILRGS